MTTTDLPPGREIIGQEALLMDRPRRCHGGSVVLIAIVVGIGGCSDDKASGDATTTSISQSWDCIAAISRVGRSTGTPVGDVRQRLEQLEADENLAVAEREYFGDLLASLDGRDDAEELGSVEDVPCPL